MKKIDIIHEVIERLTEKQVRKITNTQKEYVIFRINVGNGGYGVTISVTNHCRIPSDSRSWNGYDFLLETSEVIAIIEERFAYKLANLA